MMIKTNGAPVLVAGMHRSGTSFVASLLSALSVDMGDELLAPDANNVRGYFEDLRFLEFQRNVLASSCPQDDQGHPDWGWTEHEQLDRSSFREFLPQAQALIADRAQKLGLWGWKDPRTTLLLDFWDALLEDARFVLVYRFPWNVADSMQRLGAEVFLRHPEYAYHIWRFYNQHLYDFYVRHSARSLLISVDALVHNIERFTLLLREKLGLELPEVALEEIYQSALFKTTKGHNPIIDLLAVTSPDCIQLLTDLDAVADIPGSGLWEKRPLASRLLKPAIEGDPAQSVDISVIIPCFDQGQFLIEAIASVEQAAPEKCELIIVNDGSQQPRTLEILELLKGCGYCIIDQPNEGLSSARNKAITLASGRYILPLDADNRIRENSLDAAIKVLDSYPQVGIVYGDRYDFGLRTGVQLIPEFSLDALLRRNFIDACAVFRKQVWVECAGYDPELSPIADWELWIHAVKKRWHFYHLPQVTFDYRVRPESLITRVYRAEFLEPLLNRLMTKHKELYEPIFIRELAVIQAQCVEYEMALQALQSRLATLDQQVKEYQALLDQQAKEYQVLSDQQAKEYQALSEQLRERDELLNAITSLRGWKLLRYYCDLTFSYLSPWWRWLHRRRLTAAAPHGRGSVVAGSDDCDDIS